MALFEGEDAGANVLLLAHGALSGQLVPLIQAQLGSVSEAANFIR